MTARHLLRPSFSSECIIPLYFNKYLSVCRNISIVLQSYTFFTKKPHNLSLFFFHIPVHCALSRSFSVKFYARKFYGRNICLQNYKQTRKPQENQ